MIGLGLGINRAALPATWVRPPKALQTLVLTGGVTATNPLVPIGDSHTDYNSAPFIWDRLKNVRNQPGEGLEGVASSAIVPMGNNGQTLSSYLADAGVPHPFADAMALNPSVVLACWLTNDVRQGALGLTIDAIRVAGSALLVQLIDRIKGAQPNAIIVLRVPAPYLTVNVSSFNYVTDGTNINPPGLAQIYTSGVRAAYYTACAARPDVILYDPQARLFGTTSPGDIGTYFANQIHQNQPGYEAEADDFAKWVSAAVPYDQSLTDSALASQPYTPWLAYSRAVEDPSRFVKVAEANAVAVVSGNTYLDFGPSAPNAQPSSMYHRDIVELVGAKSTFKLAGFPPFSAQAINTRILLNSGQTVPATAVTLTKVRVYRQTKTGDAALNALLASGGSLLKVGCVAGGSTSYLDIEAVSLTAINPSEAASAWVSQVKAGDKIYVEGAGGSPITLSGNFTQAGGQMRATGLSGTDWSQYSNRMVVVYRP